MKKKNNTSQRESGKDVLLRKLEENYLSYLKDQIKHKEPRATESTDTFKHHPGSDVPEYYIDDISSKKKTKEDLTNMILKLKEDPLGKMKKRHQKRDDQIERAFSQERTPGRKPPQTESPATPGNDSSKLSLDSFEMSEEDIIHQIEQEVSRQERHGEQQRGGQVTTEEEEEEEQEPLEIEEVFKKAQPRAEEEDEYTEGAIISFEDGTVGIYISSVEEKDYDLIYCLRENGKIEPQGIPLYSYEHKVIGKLPEERLQSLRSRMRWTREEIIYYLNEFEFITLIPSTNNRKARPEKKEHIRAVEESQPVPPRQPPEKVEEKKEEPTLVQGRKIIIKAPRNSWEAVYWGADKNGPIVAHKTHGQWDVMHLDFARFGDRIEYGDVVSSSELEEIQRSLQRKQF